MSNLSLVYPHQNQLPKWVEPAALCSVAFLASKSRIFTCFADISPSSALLAVSSACFLSLANPTSDLDSTYITAKKAAKIGCFAAFSLYQVGRIQPPNILTLFFSFISSISLSKTDNKFLAPELLIAKVMAMWIYIIGMPQLGHTFIRKTECIIEGAISARLFESYVLLDKEVMRDINKACLCLFGVVPFVFVLSTLLYMTAYKCTSVVISYLATAPTIKYFEAFVEHNLSLVWASRCQPISIVSAMTYGGFLASALVITRLASKLVAKDYAQGDSILKTNRYLTPLEFSLFNGKNAIPMARTLQYLPPESFQKLYHYPVPRSYLETCMDSDEGIYHLQEVFGLENYPLLKGKFIRNEWFFRLCSELYNTKLIFKDPKYVYEQLQKDIYPSRGIYEHDIRLSLIYALTYCPAQSENIILNSMISYKEVSLFDQKPIPKGRLDFWSKFPHLNSTKLQGIIQQISLSKKI